jgi:hypothetical protein
MYVVVVLVMMYVAVTFGLVRDGALLMLEGTGSHRHDRS